MKLNYKKDLSSKWVLWVLIILVICCFKGCAKAASLNMSDFEYDTYRSSKPYGDRLCTGTNTVTSNNPYPFFASTCDYSISDSEWANFTTNNHNFLIWNILHSGVMVNSNPGLQDQQASRVLNYIIDYTLSAYLIDSNGVATACDIVNDNAIMCRYGSTRITTVRIGLTMTNGVASGSSVVKTNLYFNQDYFLTTYGSVKNSIKVIQDSITDSSVETNTSGNNAISQFQSLIPTNGTITNLVLLPLNLVNAYSVGMSGTCSSLNLGTIFDTEIILPCISMQNLVGSVLWGIIDIIVGGLMVFAIGKKMVRVFNDLTSLRDNQIDELYGGGA